MSFANNLRRRLNMKKPADLNRTCLTCGLDKPLAAFLQLSGAQGTVYGNVCSDCRSIGARNKNAILPQEEESQRGGSGLRIDAKTKIQQDIERKQHEKKLTELDIGEKNRDEKLLFEKIEKKDLKEKSEKDHRTTFIESKKQQGFLGIRTTQPVQPTNIEQAKLEASIEQENQLKNIDFNNIDPQTAGLKVQSVNFKFLESFLGESANFRTTKRITNAKPENKNQPGPQKDDFTNYAEKTFTPGRKR